MKTCCFLGHRTINVTMELRDKIIRTIERLIVEEKVENFMFGSKSQFDSLCLECATELKEKYPHIKRIYVRAEYFFISDEYKNYLLRLYDDTYYPRNITRAGRAAYVERNYEMINQSDICVIYYNESDVPTTRKSGTKIALEYAIKHKKKIIMFP